MQWNVDKTAINMREQKAIQLNEKYQNCKKKHKVF